MVPSSRDARRVHPNVAKVAEAARPFGVRVEATEFPDGTRTAEDAARAIGCEVAQIVKSLVFLLDGSPVIALVSGANRLDEAHLAAALGGEVVGRADADAVRAATGFSIGGVPPFGHPSALPTAIDEDLLTFHVVWAAAGTPHHVFPLSPGDLVQATGGGVHRLKVG
jgi:prolyl-tRNA editing enzyme YbaK/EbsC (Cys-tRNA(Pro) deacylase)